MPTIPLITQGAVNADFNGPRQTGGGTRIDTSELQQAYGALKQATGQGVRIPLVDVSSGLKDVGQALTGVGQQMLQLQQRNQDMTNTRKMADIQAAYQQSQDELTKKLSDRTIDPNQYAKIAEEHNRAFLESIDTEGMTEDARHHLVDNWLKTQISKSNTTAYYNGVMKNDEMTRASLDANADFSERNFNPLGFIEAEKEKERLGLQTSQETANNIDYRSLRMRDKAKGEIDAEVSSLLKQGKPQEALARFQRDDVRMKYLTSGGTEYWYSDMENAIMKAIAYQGYKQMMAENPSQFLGELKKARSGEKVKLFDGVSSSELMNLENETYAVIQEESNKATYDARNNVERGVLTKESELFSNPTYNKMSPVDKSAVRAILQKRQIEGTKFNPEAWMAFATSIPSIEVGTPKGKLAEAQMRNFIGIVFPGQGMENYRNALEQMLDKHMAGSPADADNQAMRILLDGFKSGGFGVTEVPYDPGKTPGYLDAILSGITLGAYKIEGRPGTTLSPEDQARAAAPEKIAGEKNRMKLRPGMPVVDQRAYEQAQKLLFDAQSHIQNMAKAGKTEKEMVDFARSVLNVGKLRGVVAPQAAPAPVQQKLKKAEDIINSLPEPDKTLFPSN